MYVCICDCLEWYYSNLLVSAEEWKKELAGYLIDYNSLDIKDAIASGLLILHTYMLNYSMYHFVL